MLADIETKLAEKELNGLFSVVLNPAGNFVEWTQENRGKSATIARTLIDSHSFYIPYISSVKIDGVISNQKVNGIGMRGSIGADTTILGDAISIGDEVQIGRGVKILSEGGTVIIENGVRLEDGVVIRAKIGETIRIGAGTEILQGAELSGNVSIGEGAVIDRSQIKNAVIKSEIGNPVVIRNSLVWGETGAENDLVLIETGVQIDYSTIRTESEKKSLNLLENAYTPTLLYDSYIVAPEKTIIQSGARIEQATVVNSEIGKKVTIREHANIAHSIFKDGSGARVNTRTFLSYFGREVQVGSTITRSYFGDGVVSEHQGTKIDFLLLLNEYPIVDELGNRKTIRLPNTTNIGAGTIIENNTKQPIIGYHLFTGVNSRITAKPDTLNIIYPLTLTKGEVGGVIAPFAYSQTPDRYIDAWMLSDYPGAIINHLKKTKSLVTKLNYPMADFDQFINGSIRLAFRPFDGSRTPSALLDGLQASFASGPEAQKIARYLQAQVLSGAWDMKDGELVNGMFEWAPGDKWSTNDLREFLSWDENKLRDFRDNYTELKAVFREQEAYAPVSIKSKAEMGTDGLRGVASSDRFIDNAHITPVIAYRLGLVAALHAMTEGKKHIRVAGDTRPSTSELLTAFISGATQLGITVIQDGQNVPGQEAVSTTPQEQYYVMNDPLAGGGAVITASHNPARDNGIKLLNAAGAKIPAQWENIANLVVNSSNLPHTLAYIIEQLGGRTARYEPLFEGAPAVTERAVSEQYFDEILDALRVLVPPSDTERVITVDAANGAGSYAMAHLAERIAAEMPELKFRLHVINAGDGVINEQAGAEYIHKKLSKDIAAGKTLPVWLEPLKGQMVGTLDGDADRNLLFRLNEDNSLEVIDGDKFAAMKVLVLQKYMKELGLDAQFKVGVAQTVLANTGSKILYDRLGIEPTKTAVGDKYVRDAADQWVKEHGVAVYYEAAGHGSILFSDAFISAVKAAEESPAKNILSAIVAMQNLAGGDGIRNLVLFLALMEREGLDFNQLNDPAFLYNENPKVELELKVAYKDNVTTEQNGALLTGPQDVIDALTEWKNRLGDDYTFIIRKSGTSPKVRVQVEGPDAGRVEEAAYSLMQAIYDSPTVIGDPKEPRPLGLLAAINENRAREEQAKQLRVFQQENLIPITDRVRALFVEDTLNAIAERGEGQVTVGTDGIRGKFDSSNDLKKKLITKPIAYRMGITAALHALSEGKDVIHIAGDTRESTPVLLQSFIVGATQMGVSVKVHGLDSVASTPQVQLFTQIDSLAGGGGVITASHNPAPDNGIKLINAEGEKISEEWEQITNEIVNSEDLPATIGRVISMFQTDGRPDMSKIDRAVNGIALRRQTSDQQYKEIPNVEMLGNDALNRYVQQIVDAMVNLNKIESARYDGSAPNAPNTVLIDATFGAGQVALEQVRDTVNRMNDQGALNFRIELINSGTGVVNYQTGAEFIHKDLADELAAGEPLPQWIEQNKGKWIFTIDGDADRSLIFQVTEDNQVQVIDGDKLAALKVMVLNKYINALGLQDRFTVGVAQTDLANPSAKSFFENLGAHRDQTPVGDKYVSASAKEWARDHGLAVYYEAAGHGSIAFNEEFRQAVREFDPTNATPSQIEAAQILNNIMSLQNTAGGDGVMNVLLLAMITRLENLKLDADLLYKEAPKKELSETVDNKDVVTSVEGRGIELTGPADLIEKVNQTKAAYKEKLEQLIKEGHITRAELPIPDFEVIIRKSGTSPVMRVQVNGPIQELVDEMSYELMDFIYKHPVINPSADPAKAPALKYEQVVANKQAELEASLTVSAEDIRAYVLGGDNLSEKEIFELRIDLTRNGWTSQSLAQLIAVHRKGGDVAVEPPAARAVFSAPDMIDISQTSAVRPDKVALGAQKDVVDRSALVLLAGGDGSRLLGSMGFADDQKALWAKPTIPVTAIAAKPPLQRIIETVASIRRQQQSNIPIVIVVGPRSKGPIKAFLDAHNNFGIENIILVEQDKNPVVKATAENQEGKLVVTPNLDIEYSPNGTGGIVDAMGKPVKVQGTDFQSAAQYLESVNRDKVIFWGGDVGGLTTELFYGILGVSKGLTGSEDVDVVGLAYPSKNKDLGTMVKMNNQTVLVIEKSDRSSYAGLEEADDTQGELNGLPRNSGGYLMSLDAIREVIGNFPVHLQANKDIEGYDPSTGQPVAKADKMETFFPDIFPLVSENRDMKIIIAVADEKDMVPQKSVPQLDRGRQELIQQDKNRLLAEHEVLIADSAVVELSPLFAGSFGSDVRLDSNAEFYIGENVFVGENVLFGEGTRVQGENIRIGNNVRIIEGASIIVEGSGELVIEDGAVIADNTRIVIKDGEKVVIGKNAYVSLAVLTGSNRVGEYSVIEQGSRIDNVQIGSNSRVSDSRVFGVKDNPVVIGSNTVISERSLITSSQKTKTWSFLEKNDLREGFIPQDENIPLRRYQIAVKQTRIGDGTTIANARLNNTEIGNNVEVQPGVAVEFSHIGNGTQLRSNTNITISWIGERAVIGSEVSKSWLGNGFSTLDQNSYISLIAPNEMLVLNENFELEIIDFANPTHIGNFVVFANYGGKPLPDLSGSLKGTAFVFSSKIGEANIVNLYDHPDVHLPDLTNEKGVTVIYQFSLVPSGEVWGTVFPFTEASTLSPASHKIGSVVKNNPRLITSMLTQMGRSLNADQRSTLLNAVAGSLRLGIKMVAAEVSTTFPRVPSSLFQGQQELLSKVTQDIPSVTRKDVAELRSRLKHLLADIDAKTPATDIARFKEVLARWAVDMEPSEQAQFELTQLMRNAKKNLQRLDQLFEGWDNYLFGLERDSFWTQQLSWSGIEMASYNEAPNTLNYVSVYSNPNVITLQDAVIDEMLNDPDTIDEILEILAGMISVMTPAERNVFDSVTGPEGTPREQVAFFNQIAKSRLIQVRNILAEKYEGIDDIEFVIRFGTERLAQNETGGDKRIILNAQALRSPYLLFAEAEHELLHEIIDSEVNTRVDGSALNEKRIVEAIVRQNILSTLRTDIESGSLERMVAEQTSAFFDSLKVFIKERYIIAKELDRIINANAAANVTGILRNPENPIDKSGKFSALINQAVAEPSNDKTQMLVADYVLQNYPGMAGMNSILAEIATVQGFIDRGVDIAKYGVAVTADDFELLRTIIDGSIFATIDHAAGITNSFGSYTIEVDANSQLLAHSLGQEELAEIQNVLVTLGYDVSVIDFDIFAGTELTDSNSLFFADTLERISQNARANAKQPEIVLFSFSQDEKTMRSFLQKRGVDLAAVKIIDRNTLIARADSDQAFLDIHRLLDTARSTENYEQLETLYANISRGDAQAKSVGNNLMKLLMELVPITVNIPELDITEVKFAAHNNALGQLAVSNNIRSIEWGKGYDNVQEGDLIEAGIDNLLLLEILEPGSEVPRELNVTAVAQGKTIRGKRVDEIFNAEYNRQKSEADDSQEFEPVITIEFLVNKLGVSYLTKEDLKGIGVKAPKRQVDRGYMQSLQSQRLFDQSA
ncbi:hypothetical protein KDK77_01565 [bacterium]|nr:hypothetical protein [bacterium]